MKSYPSRNLQERIASREESNFDKIGYPQDSLSKDTSISKSLFTPKNKTDRQVFTLRRYLEAMALFSIIKWIAILLIFFGAGVFLTYSGAWDKCMEYVNTFKQFATDITGQAAGPDTIKRLLEEFLN